MTNDTTATDENTDLEHSDTYYVMNKILTITYNYNHYLIKITKVQHKCYYNYIIEFLILPNHLKIYSNICG